MTTLARTAQLVGAAALLLVTVAQTPVASHPGSYTLERLADGLTLPVHALALDDGTGRVLVVRLDGVIEVVENGSVRAEPFLSLSGRVTAQEGEQGLFTVALESAEAAHAAGRPRQLIAAYTEKGTGDLLVSAFQTDSELNAAEHASEVVLLRIEVVDPFHHGGQVAFGPDGLLYLSVGTGQRYEDFGVGTNAISQSGETLRGKLLRFALPTDLRHEASGGEQWTIEPEVYAIGFRNPWKFSFDPTSGRLLLADVGEDIWEEINEVVQGGNYGWPSREGPECFMGYDGVTRVDLLCETSNARDMIDPLAAYRHLHLDPDGGVAVVAGVVVRDPGLGALMGRYLYADYAFGRIWSLELETGDIELVLEAGMPITSIVYGPDDTVLLTSFAGGLYRLTAAR